jgi:hypothetical protein
LQHFDLHQAEHEQGLQLRFARRQRPFEQAAGGRAVTQPPACALAQQRGQQCAVTRIV